MEKIVYLVLARRWGDMETHCYLVGIFNSEKKAKHAAAEETDYRGGKYECDVIETSIMDEWASTPMCKYIERATEKRYPL